MGKSKHRVYSKKEEREDKETISKLKETIRDLQSHNRQLKSQIGTLEAAFEKAREFMQNETNDLTLEELIEAANKHYTLKEAKKQKREELKKRAEKEKNVDIREKWKKWRNEKFGKYEEE